MKYKEGDYIERKGAKSGLWFPGSIKRIEGNKIVISIWGWEQNEEEAKLEVLRPLSSNNIIKIRKGGSLWAEVTEDGTIRISGSIVGSISEEDGCIRKNGSIVGYIYLNGILVKDGSEVGAIWPSSELYRNGSIIGEIDNQDGTIRLGGSIWGNIDNFTHKWRDFRYTATILAFFAPEFGY